MANDGGQSEQLRPPIEVTPQSEQVQELVKHLADEQGRILNNHQIIQNNNNDQLLPKSVSSSSQRIQENVGSFQINQNLQNYQIIQNQQVIVQMSDSLKFNQDLLRPPSQTNGSIP